MKTLLKYSIFGVLALVFAFPAGLAAQVDVGRRTMAITYPLGDSVRVPFRGTTRFPRMKGNAKVERTAKRGTQIELSVDNMPRPFELGAGYATYVVWAISPTGQTDNLGEIKRSSLGFIDSKVIVTTPLQTFSIIVTAEPHFMVTRPSQQIMLENIGASAPNGTPISTTPAVSYFGNSSDYFRDPRTPQIAEIDYAKTPPAILQAMQAIALARFAGAERDASAELNEAETLLQNANNAFRADRNFDTVDIAARRSIAAAVRAESLAVQRKEARDRRNEQTRNDAEIRAAENRFSDAQNEIAELREELARERRNRELAERDVMNQGNQVRDLRDENGRLREEIGRIRVELDTANAKVKAAENEKLAAQLERDNQAKAARIRSEEGSLIASLKAYGTVVKNERGIVLTLPESLWAGPRSTDFMPQANGRLTGLSEVLVNHPDYRIMVESHTDNRGEAEVIQTLTDRRSYSVADQFTRHGVAEARIVAKGLGASLPVAPNTTNANRAKNRRMQVILSLAD